MKERRKLPQSIIEEILLFDKAATCLAFSKQLKALLYADLKKDNQDHHRGRSDKVLWREACFLYNNNFRDYFAYYPDLYSIDHHKQVIHLYEVILKGYPKKFTRSRLDQWSNLWFAIDSDLAPWDMEVSLYFPERKTLQKIPIQRLGMQNISGAPFNSEEVARLAKEIGVDLKD